MYDIIPDIHGDYFKLKKTLISLGYEFRSHGWVHPQGRKAIFLGDFIDGGMDNGLIIKNVREMMSNGNAYAIMGNHELNALLYHTVGSDGNYLREHTVKNTNQHQSFLREFPLNSKESQDVLDWFISLPLFLEFEGFRVVHAFWDYESILTIKNVCNNNKLSYELLESAADLDNLLGVALETILKGPEVPLPNDVSIKDNKGVERENMRFKWWNNFAKTYRDCAVSVPEKQLKYLPNIEISDERVLEQRYSDTDKPLFFGHYKLNGTPEMIQQNVLCLDCPEYSVAYRWNKNDKSISQKNILVTSRF
jgi:hypothetical protein